MRQRGATRDTRSSLVRDWREQMGMTQQQLASEVLDCSVVTVARYETSHPPKGKTLLWLAAIATDRGFKTHAEAFLNEAEKDVQQFRQMIQAGRAGLDKNASR